MRIITLTSDFGTQDWFVGTMKGVILGINPRAQLVDLSHEVNPGDISGGAFALSAACQFFPKGTIHVAVVDPGVGSERRAIAVKTANYWFVGPDNGLLSFALKREKVRAIHRLDNQKYFLKSVSRTFHGRDVFAPVAAHLSRGVPIHKFGTKQEDLLRLNWPEPQTHADGHVDGEIVYIDRFGNAITNVQNTSVNVTGTYEVFVGRKQLCPIKAFYASVPAGEPVAVPGSTGFVEIAINGSSAAKKFGLTIGDRISVRLIGH